MKKSLSGIGVFVTDKAMETFPNSIYMNQYRPLYIIFSSYITTKYALLQVNIILLR
jgi:hypothetical protein